MQRIIVCSANDAERLVSPFLEAGKYKVISCVAENVAISNKENAAFNAEVRGKIIFVLEKIQ